MLNEIVHEPRGLLMTVQALQITRLMPCCQLV